ncbi:MAG: hypothetical protein WDW36_001118 [Sanguina aurantia]
MTPGYAEIRSAADVAFSNTEEVVVAAFQETDEPQRPRLLCLTVRRDRSGVGFTPSLHVCKLATAATATSPVGSSQRQQLASSYQVSHTYPMEAVLELRLSSPSPSPAAKGRQDPNRFHGADEDEETDDDDDAPAALFLLEWRIAADGGKLRAQDGATGAMGGRAGPGVTGGKGGRLLGSGAGTADGVGPEGATNERQFLFGEEQQQLLCAALVVELARQQQRSGHVPPRLVGIQAHALSAWWLAHRSRVLPMLGDFAADLLTGVAESPVTLMSEDVSELASAAGLVTWNGPGGAFPGDVYQQWGVADWLLFAQAAPFVSEASAPRQATAAATHPRRSPGCERPRTAPSLALPPGGEGDAAASDDGGGGGGGGAVLMSAKEGRDMEELLELFAMGIGDVAGFEGRLQAEYELLEVCVGAGCLPAS